jgi:hypothetical protein
MQLSRAAVLLATLLIGDCERSISTTTLRLASHSEGEREWIEVLAPESAKQANVWIQQCVTGSGQRRAEVIYQSPRLLSLACRRGSQTVYASFRVLNGQHLRLSDVIQPGAEQDLTTAAERAERKMRRPAQRVAEDFALTAQGLIFFDGVSDVIIPSTELRPLLQPEAALLVGR